LDNDQFVVLKKSAEEDEHSLEMHLPYIFKVFNDAGKDVELLPMMVGQVKKADIPKYAKDLENHFMDPRTLFVISSDFCHWGEHFDYQPKHKDESVIWRSIERLDKEGIAHIEKHDLKAFQ